MMVGSFIAMYILMYAMVSDLPNAVPNLNQAYMAALMVAPMMVMEVGLMHDMYPSKAANLAIAAAGAVLLVAMWSAIRAQAAIEDRQFLKSMIPHHSGAVLMCRQAALADAEVKRLCSEIVESQQREIAQMKRILERLGD